MRNTVLACLIAAMAFPALAQKAATPSTTPIKVATSVKVTTPVSPAVSPVARKAAFDQLKRKRLEQKTHATDTLPRISVPATTVVRQPRAAESVRLPNAKVRPLSYRERMGYTRLVSGGEDCDDSRRNVNPNASEVCNGYDDNCDGAVDENATLLFYLDGDGDGYGDRSQPLDICPDEQRYAAESGNWLSPNGRDCDDRDPNRWQNCTP